MTKIIKLIKENYFLRGILYIPYCYFKSNKRKSELYFLSLKYNTDKSNADHTFLNLSYLDVYDRYFSDKKFDKLKFLEIGVRSGDSLRLWREYFKNAKIFGLDFNEDCKKHEGNRINITIGSQGSEDVLEKLIHQAGDFDIIIDDGSHINELTLFSFNYLFKYLKKGGIYIFEDISSSYFDLDKSESTWDGELTKNRVQGVNLHNKREDMDKFFLNIIKDLDFRKGEIKAIHFWYNLVIILK